MNYRSPYRNNSYRPTNGYRIGAYGDGSGMSLPPPPLSPFSYYSAQDIDGTGTSNAAFADGALLSLWKNKGSLGSAADLTAAGGARPAFTKVASAGKMNNLSSVRSSGTQWMGSSAITLQAQPLTWCAVVFKSAGAGSRLIFDGSGTNRNAIYAATNALHVITGGTDVDTLLTISDAAFHTVTAAINGAATTVTLDGAASGTLNPGVQGIDTINVMANFSGAGIWFGDVLELVGYQGASAPTQAALTAWATSIYGQTPQ